MATRKKTSTKKKSPSKGFKAYLKDERVHRIIGLLLLLFSFFLLISLTSYVFTHKADQSQIIGNELSITPDDAPTPKNALGVVGAKLAHFFIRNLFGIASFLFVLVFFAAGVNIIMRKKILPLWKLTTYSFVGMIWFSIAFAFANSLLSAKSGLPWGGAFGNYLAGSQGLLTHWVKPIGTGAVIVVSALVILIWVFNINFNFLLNLFDKKPETSKAVDAKAKADEKTIISAGDTIFEKDKIDDDAPKGEPIVAKDLSMEVIKPKETDDNGFEEVKKVTKEKIDPEEDLELAIEESKVEAASDRKDINTEYDPTLDLSHYKYPTLDLLEEYGEGEIRIDAEELERNKNQIIQTLSNYKIDISKIKATIGPTVTLYEIVPAPGVRISKIKNLEDDIALSLAALGIRIIAPIPGKGTIGIEVPNEHKETVSMKSMIASEKFRNTKMDLPICLGKNISNEIIIADLGKMPHLLVAGATGQGKSVGINAILVSLLYKKHPSQLKFVMVDPKKVELSIYSAIEKHYLAKLPDVEEPIITDTTKVVNTMNALCIEMDDRYELLKNALCRNVKEYNAKFIARKLNPQDGHRYMPYIVVVVDEFADLIMTAGKEIETPIARLAQLARAIGIHLILATQRPSVKIITGNIKANFPARIAFKVTSSIDSRTILDSGGAEQLIGRGDMLLAQGSDTERLQCGFVDTPEVERIVDHIKAQQGYPSAFMLPEYVGEDGEGAKGGYSASERDALFEDAARLVVSNQMGSTSMIQRKMKLGYNRAGRLMDQLEDAGIVGANAGSKAREVLFTSESELEQYLQNLRETS